MSRTAESRRWPRRVRAAVVALAALTWSFAGGTPASAAGEFEEGPPALGGSFVSMGPVRVLDTRRPGEGPCVSGTRTVAVPGLPEDGASAVALNVTVTGAKAPGYVSVYAAGAARPSTSSVNYAAGRTVENSVTAEVGEDGLSVFASGGCPQVIVDLVGYYRVGATARGGAFAATGPSRVVDTRRAGEGPCVAGTRQVAVPDLPAAGVGGVVLNVTVTGAKAPGYVSVFAAGSARPATSSVNYAAGQTVANGVVSGVGPGGLSVFASGGCPQVIVDLVGWFSAEDPILEGSFVGVAPSRVLDTRRAGEGPCVSGTRQVAVPGLPEGVTGVVANVTVTGAKAPGYVSVFAAGAGRPATSTLNFGAGQTVANGATSSVGVNGLSVFASGGCPHVIVDVVGYYTGEPEPLTGVVQITSGILHACALIDDGTVRCWGADHPSDLPGAQLGDGRHESSAFPVPVAGIDDAVFIDAGFAATCAIHEDATVTCWGWDVVTGDLEPGIPPTRVAGIDGVVSVATSQIGVCAARVDGTVWCWGETFGMLGEPRASAEPRQVPDVVDVVEVAAGDQDTCARHADGSVTCWGAWIHPDGGIGLAVPELDDAVALEATSGRYCAIRSDGSVWCWVADPGTPSDQLDGPTEVAGIADAIDISMGYWDLCAVTSDGSVDCVAWDEPGTVAPVPGLSDVAEVAAGIGGGCARTGAGQVRCWGVGYWGHLGNGSLDDSDAPVNVIAGVRP